MLNCCVIRGGSGGGVLLDYWHEHTSLFVGFIFGSAGKPLTLFFSETARPQLGLWQKIRVIPNYLVVFLLLSSLILCDCILCHDMGLEEPFVMLVILLQSQFFWPLASHNLRLLVVSYP
jgi:hypothetical protein